MGNSSMHFCNIILPVLYDLFTAKRFWNLILVLLCLCLRQLQVPRSNNQHLEPQSPNHSTNCYDEQAAGPSDVPDAVSPTENESHSRKSSKGSYINTDCFKVSLHKKHWSLTMSGWVTMLIPPPLPRILTTTGNMCYVCCSFLLAPLYFVKRHQAQNTDFF